MVGIGEMQIKTMLRCPAYSRNKAGIITRNQILEYAGKAAGEQYHSRWECKLAQPLWESERRLLKSLTQEIPFNPVITFLGVFPRHPVTGIYACPCLQLHNG